MWLYDLLSRIFPRSFAAKLFFVAFCGVHVPLIALALWALSQAGPLGPHLPWLFWGLVATLAGTFATFWAIHAILAPLFRVEQALRAFEQDGDVQPLPWTYRDEVGRLMRLTNRLVLHVDQRLTETLLAAETDLLTGVANRRGFERHAALSPPGAVLMIDIDGFKQVNDSHGHAIGDEVLRDVARVMAGALRPIDILARCGGEEFVVQMPGTDAAEAMVVAERLRAAVEAGVRAGGLPVTVSVGVAVQTPGSPIGEAMRRSDKGTYAAKSAGRNRVMAGPAAEARRAA